MSEELKKGKESLRRRASHFLSTDLYGRREVALFCERAAEVGDVAIFGGMLRDLLLEGNERFCSDVDLVIDTDDMAELERMLAAYSPARNSFGGYRIRLQKWAVDIWPLESTWAIRNGHVHGDSLADLVKTTFFNWDAIVYELRSGKIHCAPMYVTELQERFLTINLRANPNPEGAALRTLRMATYRQAKLSFLLAEYVADVIETVGMEALLRRQRQNHNTGVRVSSDLIARFLDQFLKIRAEQSVTPISLANKQFELALNSHC